MKGISRETETGGERKLKCCKKILKTFSTENKPIIYSVPIFSLIVFFVLFIYFSPQELYRASYSHLHEPNIQSKHVKLK